ncbi:hypothetical protein KP509_15G019400 [Ceratopteris richardii]|uniref:Dehydroascorbate reductase n=1 Tax=Ceratopteris richardii TaxID=49495 RepID=A0A8T2T1J2_CERRI|nr:hypothetical protein KP509_15G019400 [Ceratopteris richardii]
MTTSAAASNIDLEVFGKAATGSGSPSKQRGDCPFSQRIYMELEEKGLPYTATYIEEGPNKPDWFMAKNPSGLMPVLRDGEQWIQDSEKIAKYLEEKYPQHPISTPPDVTSKWNLSNIFQSFTKWLKSKNPEDSAKEEYIKEIKDLNDHLEAHGPYIAGKEPTDADFALAPKLRHARVALEHYMAFVIPQEFAALHKYIELMESRPSFRKTDSPDDMIIKGWQMKFDLPDRIVKPVEQAA